MIGLNAQEDFSFIAYLLAWRKPSGPSMKIISVDKLTVNERAKLAATSRKVRPTAVQRTEFAKLRQSWIASKVRKAS